MVAFFKISFLSSLTKVLFDSKNLQLYKFFSHILVKTFIFKASDLISFVRNLIDILILSF
jgi:hypothetical protein